MKKNISEAITPESDDDIFRLTKLKTVETALKNVLTDYIEQGRIVISPQPLRLLTLKEVAEILNCCEPAVGELVDAGLLRPVAAMYVSGGKRRFTSLDVDNLIRKWSATSAD